MAGELAGELQSGLQVAAVVALAVGERTLSADREDTVEATGDDRLELFLEVLDCSRSVDEVDSVSETSVDSLNSNWRGPCWEAQMAGDGDELSASGGGC